jgi:hypothetical protein
MFDRCSLSIQFHRASKREVATASSKKWVANLTGFRADDLPCPSIICIQIGVAVRGWYSSPKRGGVDRANRPPMKHLPRICSLFVRFFSRGIMKT